MTQDHWVTTGITMVGLIMACATIPQIIRVRHRKSSEDVSVITYVILGVGNVAWLAYGIYRSDLPIIITNAVAMCFTGATVGISMKYR